MLHAIGHHVAMCCDVLRHLGCCWLKFENGQIFHATFVDVAWCCSRLTRFVQQFCTQACALVRFSIPNMSQHVATGWPNARNMLHPTMLRYVVLKCCDRLAGACQCWANDVAICCVDMLWSFGWGFILTREIALVPSTNHKRLSTRIRLVHKQWNYVVHGVRTYKMNFYEKYHLYRFVVASDRATFNGEYFPQNSSAAMQSSELMLQLKNAPSRETTPWIIGNLRRRSTTELFLLPCLADSGSCLQYLSPSMYSPVNAIKSLLFSASPFIDTYRYKSNVWMSSSWITQTAVLV